MDVSQLLIEFFRIANVAVSTVSARTNPPGATAWLMRHPPPGGIGLSFPPKSSAN
jgi:hypothetical protein